MTLTILLEISKELYRFWHKNFSDTEYPKGCSVALWAGIIFFAVFICTPLTDFYVGLFRISIKAGISPSIPALETYLTQEAFVPGMSQDEVHNILYSTGVWVKIADTTDLHRRLYPEEKGFREYVTLWIGYWPLNRFDLSIEYDERHVLTSVSIHDDPS